ADAHPVLGHRGVDRRPRLVDVEEGAVDGGDRVLPVGTARHDVAGGATGSDLACVADVNRQGIRGEVGGEDVAVVPSAVLETGEVRQFEARGDAFGLRGAEDRTVLSEVFVAGRGGEARR